METVVNIKLQEMAKGDDSGFADHPTIDFDTDIGNKIAAIIGDTWIESYNTPPSEQWAIIVKAFRVHGVILNVI